jgi:hypothetical protein
VTADRLAAIRERNNAVFARWEVYLTMSYRDPASAFPPKMPGPADNDIRWLIERVDALERQVSECEQALSDKH